MNKLYNKFVFLAASVALAWVLIESAFYYIALGAQKNYMTGLLDQAEQRYTEIQNIRRWNADLNGVYALSDTMEPNPYLKDNLVNSGKGKRFVKINPAWMTRMLAQQNNNSSDSFKLVSNSPLNPFNQATGFSKDALEKLKKSDENSFEKQYILNKTSKKLRYVRPVYVEAACLKCHIDQGYKLGDVHGGVEFNIDASFYVDRMEDAWAKFYAISGLFALFSLLLLFFIRSLAIKTMKYEQLSSNLQEEVNTQTQKLELALKGSGLGYWHWNVQTAEHEVDERWLNILGLVESDINCKTEDWDTRIHPQDKKIIMPIIEEAISKKHPYVVEFRMLHKEGHYVWIQGSGGVTKMDDLGNPLELSGTHQDISKRKTMEIEHHQNELYLSTLYEKNPNIIIVTDGNHISKANGAFFRLFKEYNSLEEFLKEHSCICDYFEKSEFCDTISSGKGQWIEDVFMSAEPIVKITYLQKEYFFAVYAKKIYEYEMIHMMVTFSDITETYKLKHEFEKLSILDALTGAYNRRHFNTLFVQEFNRARRAEQSFCFAILDIDNFKYYNDTYGHDMGDIALKDVASALSQSIKRSNEFFFRLGGEEFGILFSGYSKEESLEYIHNLCKEIQKLEIEHSKNLPSGVVTISIGLCYVGACINANTKMVYSKADKALYEAKNSGRNRAILTEYKPKGQE